jgi:hypothetical protein
MSNSETPPAPPEGKVAAPAAKAMFDASLAEDTRFNNINNRGIALVAASSLVTALIGVYAKDVMSEALEPIRSDLAPLLTLTVALLVAAVGVVIIRVLLPGGRPAFGNNAITDNPSTLTTEDAVAQVVWREYWLIHRAVQARNVRKAKGIHLAYWLFGAATVVGAFSVFRVLYFAYGL